MTTPKKILLLLTVCCTVSFLLAQGTKKEIPDKYRAVHWGVEEGLSYTQTYCVLKDVNGFLWIGTGDGLNRFDGNTFKSYFHNPQKAGTVGGSKILKLIEDSLNNIWIGTDKGLSRYDIKADTFTNFFPEVAGANKSIVPLCATRTEVYCMETDSVITAYSTHSPFLKKVLIKLPFAFILPRYAYFDSAANCIWMLPLHTNGLIQFFLASKTWINHNWPVHKKNPSHSDSEAMCYDRKRNSIWINSPDGLIEFTLSDKQFHQVDALKEFVKLKNYGRWVGIDIDPKGRVWFATFPRGIIMYDPAQQLVIQPFAEDTVLLKEVSEYNMCIYCDPDGIVWSGFWYTKGVYQLIPFSPAVTRYTADAGDPHSLSHNLVYSCRNAGKSKVWIGTADGLNIFDTETGLFQVLREKDLPGIRGDSIYPIAIDTIAQKAWLATGPLHGLTYFEMDLITKTCIPVIFRDSANGVIRRLGMSIAKPYKNSCIITADYGNQQGIFIVNSDSAFAQQVLSFPRQTINPYTTITDDDRLLFLKRQDAPGNLTYTLTNKKWILTSNPMDSVQWISLFPNKADQTYWLVAFQQLIHYSKDFRVIGRYTPEDGLPTMEIYSLIPDNRGNIWFRTDRSIYQLNIKTGKIAQLSENDGFQPQNFTALIMLAFKDGNGDIYFHGAFFGTGFNRIRPDKFKSSPSTVYLQSLKINQNSVPIPFGLNNQQVLSLKYFENKISIETGIIDYYSRGKSRIRYKLEGRGENWQYAPYYHTIRYEELPPGKYTLLIQASNAANEFIGPVKRLQIRISPAFWQTWWFRILAIVFAVAVIYGLIHYRSRQLNARNILLEKKVVERTNELNHSLAELKTAQDQLIQSEKMASLGELTSGIAHEIKNPLNFINNFSEINMELITEIEEEQIPNLDKTNQAQLAPIINTLKKNSEKINHHGHRVDGIVKGMLQHSRLGHITKEPVNINSLCDESLKLAYHGFRAKEKTFNASFETQYDPDLPQIMVIPQDLARVLLNLINNAFYTVNEKKKQNGSDQYEPSVIVSTKKSGDNIYITVSDNGMGIPSQIINKIFQPFFTTKPTGEGTGLGLSMSYDIVSKSHGGELRVKTKEGLGTDFEVILPI